ncbi:MAG: hypothetical protein WCE44_07615, partial [Candidatus Velthaea sp.]
MASQHVSVASQHVSVASQHVSVASQHVSVASQHVSVASQHVILSLSKDGRAAQPSIARSRVSELLPNRHESRLASSRETSL